jgi:hypothetical protein
MELAQLLAAMLVELPTGIGSPAEYIELDEYGLPGQLITTERPA